MRSPWLCVAIVLMLGGGMILCIAGIIALALNGRSVPEALVVTAGTCVGALASFLVQPPRGSIGVSQERPPPPLPPPAPQPPRT